MEQVVFVLLLLQAAIGGTDTLVNHEIVTAVDEWIENRARLLPQNERVPHVLLTLNLGLIIAALVPVLREWGARETALVATERGWMQWLLVACGAASAAWSVRDLLAVRRLGHDGVLEPVESP